MSPPIELTITTDSFFTSRTYDLIAGTTALHDFLFRQLSSAQGRWLVPDPAGLAAVDLTNPQTWNRYAYVANNPMGDIDPLGLSVLPVNPCGQDATCWRAYSQSQNSSHASGVPGFSGNFSSWNGGLGFVPVQTVSTSAELQGYQWVPPNESTGTTGHWELSSSNGSGSLGLWSGTTELNYSLPNPIIATNIAPKTVSGYAAFLGGVGGITTTITHFSNGTNCVGGAATVSTPGTKEVSAGPLVHGNLDNAQQIVSGWGWNFNIQVTPFIGYQVLINGSGVLGGPTVAFAPGVTISFGRTGCTP